MASIRLPAGSLPASPWALFTPRGVGTPLPLGVMMAGHAGACGQAQGLGIRGSPTIRPAGVIPAGP